MDHVFTWSVTFIETRGCLGGLGGPWRFEHTNKKEGLRTQGRSEAGLHGGCGRNCEVDRLQGLEPEIS